MPRAAGDRIWGGGSVDLDALPTGGQGASPDPPVGAVPGATGIDPAPRPAPSRGRGEERAAPWRQPGQGRGRSERGGRRARAGLGRSGTPGGRASKVRAGCGHLRRAAQEGEEAGCRLEGWDPRRGAKRLGESTDQGTPGTAGTGWPAPDETAAPGTAASHILNSDRSRPGLAGRGLAGRARGSACRGVPGRSGD